MANNKMLDSMKQKLENKIISWEAPEFIYYPKNLSWYIILILITLGIATVFYFMENYLAIAVAIFAGITLFITSKQKPKKRLCKISKDTIEIGEKIYPMNSFKSFFTTYTDNSITNLHFERDKRFTSPISLLLTNVDESQVIDFIRLFLPENQRPTIPVSDTFSKWFKF